MFMYVYIYNICEYICVYIYVCVYICVYIYLYSYYTFLSTSWYVALACITRRVRVSASHALQVAATNYDYHDSCLCS